MSDLRVAFGNDKIGRTYSRSVSKERDRVLASMRGTARQIEIDVLLRGKIDIRRASPAFAKSKRWAEGLKSRKTEGGGTIKVTFFHLISYFLVHERGAVIRGRPLLWLPLSWVKEAQGVRARDFKDPLFRVDRVGKAPLLLSIVDKKPKYVGLASVKIPARFHIFSIIRDVVKKSKELYRREFRKNKG